MNPDYEYQFFDDKDIEDFISQEYDLETYEQYSKINIGAAKADFFSICHSVETRWYLLRFR